VFNAFQASSWELTGVVVPMRKGMNKLLEYINNIKLALVELAMLVIFAYSIYQFVAYELAK
jgi:hypothetical protein